MTTPPLVPGPFDDMPPEEVADATIECIRRAVGTAFIVGEPVWNTDKGVLTELLVTAQDVLDQFDYATPPTGTTEVADRAYLNAVMRQLPLGSGERPRITQLVKLVEGLLDDDVSKLEGICRLIVQQIMDDKSAPAS